MQEKPAVFVVVDPNEVAAEIAKEINAELAVMGTLNQYGETGLLLCGYTPELVIGSLDIDVMVCNAFTNTAY